MIKSTRQEIIDDDELSYEITEIYGELYKVYPGPVSPIPLRKKIDQKDHKSAEAGNTGTASCTKKKQGKMSLYWCFTYNNYEIDQIDLIVQVLKHECDWYVFQEELGEQGTKHLQGTLKLKKRKRLTGMKKLINNKIHFEITRSCKSSIVYCSKLETRNGEIYTHNIDIPEEIKVCEPYGWQLQVLDIIKTEPDNRTIWWFWEPIGNIGKSELCKYLVVKHNAVMCSGKKADMFHILTKTKNKKLIIIDIPRSQDAKFISYGGIEQIKNGLIFSGKYDSCQLVFNSPHVIIFANEPPKRENMSGDRWKVVQIERPRDEDYSEFGF